MNRNELIEAGEWDFAGRKPEISFAPLFLIDIVHFPERNTYVYYLDFFQRFDEESFKKSSLYQKVVDKKAESIKRFEEFKNSSEFTQIEKPIKEGITEFRSGKMKENVGEFYRGGQKYSPDGMPKDYIPGEGLDIRIKKTGYKIDFLNVNFPDGTTYKYPQLKEAGSGVVPITGEKYFTFLDLKNDLSDCLSIRDWDIIEEEKPYKRGADVLEDDLLINLPDKGTYFMSDPLYVTARIVRRDVSNPVKISQNQWESEMQKAHRQALSY
jgi:hypothetical protein